MREFGNIGYFQKQRLEFIEFRLEYFNHFNRQDLIDFFGCGPASATRDIALYKKVASDNLKLSFDSTQYVRMNSFSPVFKHCKYRVLEGLARGFCGLSFADILQKKIIEEQRIELKTTCEEIAIISRAISLQTSLQAIANGELTIIKPSNLTLEYNGDLSLECYSENPNYTQYRVADLSFPK